MSARVRQLMRRLWMVKDLPDLVGASWPRPVLRCPKCGETYSAHKGDYFMLPPETTFTCDREECDGVALQLVTIESTIIPFVPDPRH